MNLEFIKNNQYQPLAVDTEFSTQRDTPKQFSAITSTPIHTFVTDGIEIWGDSPSAQLKRLSNKIDKS